MKKIITIVRSAFGRRDPDVSYDDYLKMHGHHFTDKLAEFASSLMINTSGTEHSWVSNQIESIQGFHNETPGDILYTANMAFADFYPTVLQSPEACIEYAKAVALDPDGYEGMQFERWVCDMNHKSEGRVIHWEDFI